MPQIFHHEKIKKKKSELEIKSTMRYHSTLTRTAVIIRAKNKCQGINRYKLLGIK